MTARKTGMILAWDKSTFDLRDVGLLHSVIKYVDLVKVGCEAIYKHNSPGNSVAECVASWIGNQYSKDVMWDAKLHDIGNTVARSMRAINERSNIRFVTVHSQMSDAALSLAAKTCAQAGAMTIGVTVLTDISAAECIERFVGAPSEVVLRFARIAHKQGVEGFVCSGHEIGLLRNALGPEVKLFALGTRSTWANANDQKRVMTPAEAARAGADYIVAGRPILEPPAGMTSADAARKIREELDNAHEIS